MRFNKLDLNLLVALDAMLEEMSISRAAERLHMSQSAMSNALARLRDYFDDELLVQVGRRMELTPRAEVLRDAVHDVLLRVDTSIAMQPEFIPSTSDREFRLFVSDYTLNTLMPHVVARAHAQAPGVRFLLQPQTIDPTRQLERGEVDMLIMPADYCSPNHPTETLFSESFSCVVWSGGRLAQGPLTFEQYAVAGHVAMQPTSIQPNSFESWVVQRYGLTRRDEITTFSFAAAPALVVGTDRIATVHTRLAFQAARHLPVTVHTPPIAFPEMKQVTQWHKYRSKDPGLLWLRQVLLQAVVDMDTVRR
ncbi:MULTISPECIES: LysR family transcriptional regulator [Ramlibacter]|uniref:LysR family transcriptional regulator n=1 Tax=Ramlibacter pinisoli TaxID=2682844 RepID=A0A6N8ILZ8_9BURK|nr:MULTISPECIES: LysR family transcriptional regulator [Ramlibacter]MBA2960499.1 LysR family transcriptional regulator [Ramlibacter sp. CGMCC 1.13660]MVQ27831.1 LysR family transcriptional regulator [Ramlibacter pinisoli]